MESDAKPDGCAIIGLLVTVAFGVGLALAQMNASTPAAKAARDLRDAEERAAASCRAAGCPDQCYMAGYC